MTIIARRVAVEGFGFGVLAIATMGLLADEQVQVQAPAPAQLPARVETRISRGGGGAPTSIDWWRGTLQDRKAKEKAELEADYALLPLTTAINVVALADGVVDTFLDEKGGLIVRLTAEDGTVFYYAKVRSVREGRVRKGDSIGVSSGPAVAPKALPAAKSSGAPKEAEQPPAVYGVLPIAPIQDQEVSENPWTPPARVAAAQLPAPRALAKPPSTTAALMIGAIIIGLALSVAYWMKPKPKKRRKKRRRRR